MPSAATTSVPDQAGVPVQTIAAALGNGPNRFAVIVTCCPPSPATATWSAIAVPGATTGELTVVPSVGATCTCTSSLFAPHSVVRPMLSSSPGTISW